MLKSSHRNAVDYSAASLLALAIVGQWAFAAYILTFYAYPAIAGDLQIWNSNILLTQPPFNPERWISTSAFGIHAIGASVVAVFGGLQIIPYIRNRYRSFHRWNGRVFIATVIALTLSGYYLTWVRGPLPDSFSDLGTSVNGILILLFVVLAFRAIKQRDFSAHERWAIRLFLVSNAQWFLRIGGFGYFLIMQSLGYSVAFDNWFFHVWIWGCFLVPLLFAELYFRTRQLESSPLRWMSAGVFLILLPVTLAGIVSFSFFSIQIVSGNLG